MEIEHDTTCWWFWDPQTQTFTYDAESCPDGPDPGYPIDPALLPDTAVDGSASLPGMSTVHYDMPDPGFLSDGAMILLTVALLTAVAGWTVLNSIRSRRISKGVRR